MSILRTAIAANRLDLAAHTLVLAAIKTLTSDLFTTGELIGANGELNDRKEKKKPQLIQEDKACYEYEGD